MSLAVSYSSINAFWECEQLYAYRYVQHLRRKDKLPQLEFGSMLHTYLEVFYRALQTKPGAPESDPDKAHEDAKATIAEGYGDLLESYAQLCFIAGDEKAAQRFAGMLASALRIVDRYYLIRGMDDAERYAILLVEGRATVALSPTIVSNGVLDLITEDRSSGRRMLWEHKSAENIPSSDRRLRDLQTLLYGRLAELCFDMPVDGVIWNYLRTKEPTVPRLLVKGGLSRDKSLDTTWQAYIAACFEHGLSPADYADVEERTKLAEWTNFFPRYDMLIMQQEAILLTDYISTAKRIEERVWQWETRRERPVRSVGYRCDRCEFAAACKAAVVNGDDSDVLAIRYTTEKEQRIGRETPRDSAPDIGPEDILPGYYLSSEDGGGL